MSCGEYNNASPSLSNIIVNIRNTTIRTRPFKLSLHVKRRLTKIQNVAINNKNMTDICRTCLLSKDNLQPLFERKLVGNQFLTLSKIISLCTGLEISIYDNFSSFICTLCSSALLQAFEYRRQCWESHRTLLKKYDNHIKLKNVTKVAIKTGDSDSMHDYDDFNTENKELEEIEVHSLSSIAEVEGNGGELFAIASSLNNRTTEDFKIVPMKDFQLHVEYKIDNSKYYGRIFNCRVCPQAYENKHYMVNHFKIAHKTIFKFENEYKCNICPKVYGNRGSYLRHKRWHKGETIYVCTYCGVKLKCKFTLTEHIRVHTGEKPYNCDYCDFRTGKRSVILVHMRTHTGERPFICHICHKTCPTTAARASHMKTHSTEFKYECNICNKKFRTPGVLWTHRLIHDPSKHKECTVCGKQFPRRTQLKTHMRVHSREYCHRCSECGKGFIQRHCWRTHMKNHHDQVVF